MQKKSGHAGAKNISPLSRFKQAFGSTFAIGTVSDVILSSAEKFLQSAQKYPSAL
jgi:hypothetical protein